MDFLSPSSFKTGNESPGYQAFCADSDGTLEWRDPWRGNWTTATAYAVGEIVSYAGGSWVCYSAHTSGATTEPGAGASWASVWAIVAQKGDTGDTGPAGADGADGATGPQGPAGPAGADGADGDPINWRSTWAPSTTYAALDAVENDGSSYVCILGHGSAGASEPGVGGSWTTYWDLMAAKGDAGATGPTGATGPAGPTGPAGADGADGADGIPFWFETIFADAESSGLDPDEYVYPGFGGNHNWRASTVQAAPAAMESATDFPAGGAGEFTFCPAPFSGTVEKISCTNMKSSTGSGSCVIKVIKASGTDPFDATGALSNVVLATLTVTSLARLNTHSDTFSSGNSFSENDFIFVIVEQDDGSTQSVPWRINIKYGIS